MTRAVSRERVGAAGLGVALAFATASAASAEESGFVPPQGNVWMSAAFERWSADERYAGPFGADAGFRGLDPDNPGSPIESGDVVPIKLDVPESRSSSEAVVVKLRVAPLERVLTGVTLPAYQRSVFEQTGTRVTTAGTGDVFLVAGYQLTPRDLAVGSALYAEAKLPTTQLEVEDLSVPLSEGQVDLGVEQATTWAVLPALHVTGRLLLRHRFEADAQVGGTRARIKPGDEMEAGVEVGGEPVRRVWLKTGYRGLWATASEDRTLARHIRPIEKRQIHWWQAGAYLGFGGWLGQALDGLALDLAFRYPLGGVDYLRGIAWSAGLAYGFDWNAS